MADLRQGLNLGDGPRRIFPLRTVYAPFFIGTLAIARVDFAVVHGRGWVDIITPYDLKADLFPDKTWIENESFEPSPFGDNQGVSNNALSSRG